MPPKAKLLNWKKHIYKTFSEGQEFPHFCRMTHYTVLLTDLLEGVRNIHVAFIIGPGHAKMCLMPYANNKGADQPAHSRSLISTFVVRCLDSMICILAISEVSRF